MIQIIMHNWLKLLISNILFLLVGLILGFVIFNISKSTPKISDSLILRDSIYQTDIKKDSLFRDSLNNANDSIIKTIIYIEKDYEKDVNNILSNDDSLNLVFFTEYIEYYNNERTTTNY